MPEQIIVNQRGRTEVIPVGPVGPPGPPGPTGSRGPTGFNGSPKEVRHNWVSPNDYIGVAELGTGESESLWTITRVTVNVDGSSTSGVCTDVSWNDRLTEVYT
jgi:hypothetical protein